MKLNWCRFQSGDSGLEAALALSALDYARSQRQAILIFDRPAPVVSFSKLDRLSPGFEAAVKAAESAGATAVSRISGGKAVAAHPGCLRLTYAAPHRPGQIDVKQRFETLSGPIARALSELGADPRFGEVPGEWCPGDHSINLAGARKVVGIGQRSASDAHHLCALITVSGAAGLSGLLEPVYRSLGYGFSPDSVGELGLGSLDDLQRALIAALSEEWEMEEIALPGEIVAQARSMSSSYLL